MPERREIGHVEARGLVAMIADRLDARAEAAAVAVVDAHGELVAFLRTDGCGLASINIAIHKAFTAARERVESSVLGSDPEPRDFRSRTSGTRGTWDGAGESRSSWAARSSGLSG